MTSMGTEYDHLRELASGVEESNRNIPESTKKLYDLVRQNLHAAYQRYSKPYNLRSNEKHVFQVDDLVYKRNVHLSDKAKHFVGKFGAKYTRARILAVVGTNTYFLENEEGQKIPGTFHGSFLKKAWYV